MSLSLAYPRVTTVGDFLALLKPRVMSLVIFTGLAGIVAAPGHLHPLTGFTALLCIAVAAGASGCLNMAYDSDIDRLMARTATRPIPLGHVAREDALAFGWTLSVAAVAVSFGLKSMDRLLRSGFPAASERLVQTDDRLEPRKLGLP